MVLSWTETFESTTPNIGALPTGWTKDAGLDEGQVKNDDAHGGSNSLYGKEVAGGTWNGLYASISPSITDLTGNETHHSGWFKNQSSTSQYNRICEIRNGAGALASLYLRGDSGTVKYYNGAVLTDSGVSQVAGWVYYEIWLNFGAGTWSAEYNGSTVCTDATMQSAQASFDKIYWMFNGTSSSWGWVDDVFAEIEGWTGKINGVTNPAKVMGIAVANVAKVGGI